MGTQRFGFMANLSIKRKLQLLIVLFLAVVTGLVSYTVSSINAQKGDTLVVNVAGRQRMLSQKVTKEFLLALHAAKQQTSQQVLDSIDKSRQLFSVSLNALTDGGTTYSDLGMNNAITLPPAPDHIKTQLEIVNTLWQEFLQQLQAVQPAQFSQQQLTAINDQSVKVLANMNKAVGMFSEYSDQKIYRMERNQIVIGVVSIIVAIFLSSLTIFSITRPLSRILNTTQRIASGNLTPTQDTIIEGKSEFASLTQNVEGMRASLHDVIGVVKANSRQMAHSAQQVSIVSGEISQASQLEQESSQQVLSAVNSLLDTSDNVSQSIESAYQLSQQTNQQAEHGLDIVKQSIDELNVAVGSVHATAEEMNELKSFTVQINEITQSIHNIAEQTNLLALNAAIEAARAGEHGRGFAVVADEVRNLAARTSSSSGEISTLLEQLTHKVESSVNSMQKVVTTVNQSQEKSDQTVVSFNEMKTGINQTMQSAEDIASSNQQQTERLKYLNNKLKELFSVLVESTSKASTTSMVAEDLFSISEQLESQLKKFDTQVATSITSNSNEKRAFPRAGNKLMLFITQGEQRIQGLTDDISLHGLKVRCSQELDKNQLTALELSIPQALHGKIGNRLMLQANIVHKERSAQGFCYGLQFKEINTQSEEKIKQLFNYFKQPYLFNK
ncbi:MULTISPECIES: methyl-accepting chemotaxis protein [unclassified Vibrio]|uniref:Methyl-accepting chemotaxis protein n=1 Tax=Vibrio sp. HB236076 TaxID=3232307 RepID=A0AB39HCP8_9VIBR|nr:methyl-accepting chemotaxis protein [Vibrio sp. HB161653]MDP5254141.1 methyl-accepting chemotaxis protein [Vibrio sp. HB161653]